MRIISLVAAVTLATTSLVSAQSFETPEALLEAFYQPYFDGEFYEDESPFRSAALQALYEADAENTLPGEMGALSFDPYIDGQDYDISDLEIGAAEIDGETAIVDVSFTNFDTPVVLTYYLAFEDGGWRIDDVCGENAAFAYCLTEIFAEAAPAE